MRNNFVENYEKMSDEEIIALINGGNYELLSLIIDRYLPRILYYVRKYCTETAWEDMIQEATIALYTAVRNYDAEKSSFSSFAALCIKRAVLSELKQKRRKKTIPDELLSPLDDVLIADCNSPEKIFIEKESYQTLTDSLKVELSGLELSVLRLYLAGKKYIEIAEELHITEKSVNNSLVRIRKKLKDK